MRFFLLCLTIVLLVGVICGLIFWTQLGSSTQISAFLPGYHATTTPASNNAGGNASTTNFVPAGFHGPPPGSVPHVNGPTSNPPNY